MPAGFQAEAASVEQLLGGDVSYRVPSYQRPYSWTTKEAGQLLDDLTVSVEEDRNGEDGGYFLGAILLMERPTEGQASGRAEGLVRRDIVDGQQRMITITILLAVLRDIADDRGLDLGIEWGPLLQAPLDGASRYRIEPHARERDCLGRYVLEPGASGSMPEDDARTPGEQRIIEVREHFISELIGAETEDLARLARYLLASCYVAVVTARSIDRAHRIFAVLNERGRPLARNDILKAQILGQVPEADREGYTAKWDALETSLGDCFEELFSHVRSIEGRTRGRIISGIADLIAAAGSAARFIDETLVPFAGILGAIRNRGPRTPPPSIQPALQYMAWLSSSDWVPAAMLGWRLCGDDLAKLEAFLWRLDRLTFALRLVGMGAEKRQTRLNGVLAALRAGTIDAADSPLELSREENRSIAYNLKNLHSRSQLTCKLLLLRLNDDLACKPQGLDPSEFTVEHVLPQRPGRNSQWRVWFPQADDRERSTHSLGNLVLVTRDQNEKARNMELARKLTAYFGGAGPVPHITKEFDGIAAWGPADVLAREERLLARVYRLWKLERVVGGAPEGKPPSQPALRSRRPPERPAAG